MCQGFVKRRVEGRAGTNGIAPRCQLMMEHFFLSTICAGVLLLVTALALGTPGLKADVPPQQTVLQRISVR
jgi:hypothetical protein